MHYTNKLSKAEEPAIAQSRCQKRLLLCIIYAAKQAN